MFDVSRYNAKACVKRLLCCAGVTGVHVAAVSSGDPFPYPGVNNTERWTALAASCPYPFTRLGAHEPWVGDKGVTKNKLMYYMKCGFPCQHPPPPPPVSVCVLLGDHYGLLLWHLEHWLRP